MSTLTQAFEAWSDHVRECEQCLCWFGDLDRLCDQGHAFHVEWFRAAGVMKSTLTEHRSS